MKARNLPTTPIEMIVMLTELEWKLARLSNEIASLPRESRSRTVEAIESELVRIRAAVEETRATTRREALSRRP